MSDKNENNNSELTEPTGEGQVELLVMLRPLLYKIHNEDCRETLAKLPAESIDLIVTSPPYNKKSVNRKCGKTDSWMKANINYGTYNDDLPENEYQEWQKKVLREMVRVIKPEGSIFYNHKVRIINHRAIIPTEWLNEFNIRQVLIWDRGNSPQIAPIRWLPTTEYIYWITKTNTQPKFYKRSKHLAEVLRISAKPTNDHPAPFPEELVETLILNTTDGSDVVYDPFSGSGTACRVADRLGRAWFGSEISERYCSVALRNIKSDLFTKATT